MSILTLLPESVEAQNDIMYNLKKYATSEQTVVDSRRWHNNDIENTQVYMARSTASLLDFLTAESDSCAFGYLKRHEYNVLSVSADNLNNSGNFIHYEGKRRTFGNVLAGGELRIDGIGTLYGMASYQTGMLTQSSLNYATHPEDIAPYFVSDTVGGSNMLREIYTIMGGYSFRTGRLNIGLEAFYEGIAQSRRHNPRLGNYTHSVNFGIGASIVMPHDILALKLTPGWSRQSITANSLQDGLRFFEFYGFGLWNRRETQGAIAYGRQHSLLGLETALTWMHDGDWNWAVSASWLQRNMNSEESSFKALFASTTHRLQQQIAASHNFNATALHLQLSATEHFRKGREAIYQQQVIDSEAGLVDYVKVGTNKLYTNNWYDADFRAKVIQKLGVASTIAIIGSGTYYHYEEKYVSPQMNIANNAFEAGVTAEYAARHGKVEWETSVGSSVKCGWNNEYGLAGTITPVQNTMSYTPFLLRSVNSHTVGGQIRVFYDMTAKLKVGCHLNARYTNSDCYKVAALELGMSLLF